MFQISRLDSNDKLIIPSAGAVACTSSFISSAFMVFIEANIFDGNRCQLQTQ